MYRIEESSVRGIRTELICDGEPLRAADVICDELYCGRKWDLDASGFNFRHCFVIPRNACRRTSGLRFEVRYAITQVTGEKTVVCFCIRGTRND